MNEGIKLLKENHIAKIIINRPKKMNSITKTMGEELHHIANIINDDKNISVVLIQGEGERSFSTGSDINMLNQYGNEFDLKNRLDYCQAVRNIRKPVISKIKGYALGGGLELVLATDIRIATPESIFAASEVKHGWISGSGATQLLARTIGYNRAAELVFTGDNIDSKEAFRLGIINKIVEVDRIDNYVDELLSKLSKQSTSAMQLIKQNLRASQNMPLDVGLSYENDLFVFSLTTEDAKEGKRAFKEKRKPNFEGKDN